MASKVPDSRLGRLGKIVSLSGKVGSGLVARAASRLAGGDGSWAERKTAQQLVATLGQMKGLAQKFGQAMSMDLDHLPAEMRQLLTTLQSKSQPMDYLTIAGVVESQLGKPIAALYASFNQTPLAAASIGQVHQATLLDGTPVAVKVQYPGAASALQSDLQNIDALLSAVGGFMGPAGAALKGQGYFEEISRELSLETDYRREATSAREYAALAAPFAELRVPRVYPELSSAQVLTLELLEGEPLTVVLARGVAVPNAQRFALSGQLIAALFGPLLARGVVHADPHPGNFLVLPDGRLGVLDFGALKHLSGEVTLGNREAFQALLDGVEPDFERLLREAHFAVHAARDEIQPIFSQFFKILRGPIATDSFDYGNTKMTMEFEVLAKQHVATLMKLRPPAEGIMLFRALGGQAQNLRALAAVGNFRQVYAEVLARAVPAASRSTAA